jgi:ankyrin repeat protein
LNAGNNLTDQAYEHISERPFVSYAAFNWHEHIVLGGRGAINVLGDARYSAILDISKPPFWGWFIPVAEKVCHNGSSSKDINEPLPSAWAADKASGRFSAEYVLFLREACLDRLFPLSKKLHALLKEPESETSPELQDVDGPQWQAEEGYHLIDSFHLAFGEHRLTSASKAVSAMEKGDTGRSLMLSEKIPLTTLIWTCITDGAPNALSMVLSSVTDIDWLHDVPEHLMFRRKRWRGWSSKSGKDLRMQIQKGWEKPWPPACVTIVSAATEKTVPPVSDEVFGVLADWIDASTSPKEFSQQLWETGGFLVPSLCSRLVRTGCAVDCEMWKDSRTALQIAAVLWEHDLIQTLLELGADPAHLSSNGYAAIHWLFHEEEPLSADVPGHMSMMSNRKLREISIGNPRYEKARIAASVKALMRPVSTSTHSAVKGGRTPLMMAVSTSQTATQALLEEGADPEQRDKRGRTALMHFFMLNFNGRAISILRHLLKAGADSRAADSSGRTVLGYWARRVTGTGLSSLYAGTNSYNKAFHALSSIGALSHRDTLTQEMTSLDVPLVVASRLGNARLCWALLDAGADPNKHGIPKKSPLGVNDGSEASALENLAWNPLMVALFTKAYVTAAILLAYGADIGFRLPARKRTRYNSNELKREGLTPLHLVVGKAGWVNDVVLNSPGWAKVNCAFEAATRPDHPVLKDSSLEALGNLQKKQYAAFREREYEVASSDVSAPWQVASWHR